MTDRDLERIEDLYKRLHQAWMGPEHAVRSRKAAIEDLRREWEALGPSGEVPEELITILESGAPFVRVHLRPWRDRGGTKEILADSFVRSALEHAASPESFRAAWRRTGEDIRCGRLPFESSKYADLDEKLGAAGYPPIHHSTAYAGALRPAYRVVHQAETPRLRASLDRASRSD